MLEVMSEGGDGAHGCRIILRGRWVEGNESNRREEKGGEERKKGRERELTSSIFLFGMRKIFPQQLSHERKLIEEVSFVLHKFGIRVPLRKDLIALKKVHVTSSDDKA